MNNNWMSTRMISMLCALPLIATAVASAQHFAEESAPLLADSAAVTAMSDALSDRVHTVSLNRAGEVEGRIASLNSESTEVEGLADLKIFFVRDGEIAQQTKTLDDGTFVVDGLSEGIYSFVATGKSGFAAYGVKVVGFDDVSKVNIMEAAAVSPRFSVVKSILEKNLPVDVADEIIAASQNAEGARIVGSNRVRLNSGQLEGHVLPILGDVSVVEGTQVHIIQNDQQIAQVEVGEHGAFMVPDLEPGIYDFVAAGPSGFAAVSFQAVEIDEAAAESVLADTDEIPVAIPAAAQDAIPADIPFDSGYSDSLDVCLTCQQDSGFVGDQIEYAGTEYYGNDVVYDSSPIEYASDSLGCGCAAGGTCGSCGDFSGASCGTSSCCGGGRRGLFGRGGAGLLGFGGLGGGLGGLATLGGLAGGIVAIADDGNNDPVDTTPSTTGS